MNAVWVNDYDYQNDKCFKRPGCPKCLEPISFKNRRGKHHCYSCGKPVKVLDREMITWFEDRSATKVEQEDCWKCGGKETMEVHYSKNLYNLEWQTMGGECKKCGLHFIV